MSAGRKPKTATVVEVIDTTLDQPKIEGAMVAMRADGIVEQTARDQRMARFSEQVGIAKYAGFQAEMCAAAQIKVFIEIKESNDFKDLPILRADGNVRPAQTLDELCPLVFGRSYRVMAEQAQNFGLLGEGAFEAVQRMGLNRHQLRLIRSLPDAQRTAVAEAIQAESKSEVVAIIEDLAAQLADSHNSLAEAKAEKIATEKLLENKNKQLDKLSRHIAKSTPDTVLLELQKETTAFTNDALGCVQGQLRQAFIALKNHGNGTADHSLFMAGLLGQVQAELAALREEFNLPDISNAREQELAAEVAQWAPQNH
jgi:anthranilate/para-aminobenzoate synthase component I